MPKIDRPFVPQQPGAGADNYIDGGPTRAGLEELRGKVNAAPITWDTVVEAEAASYAEPESVVVAETGRTYTYSASSGATRDGIRVLTPAGGGRLLATKTGSDDVEVPKIGTLDHQSLTQSLQVGLSAGACSGNFVTDAGGGTINIASGEGMIRATNSSDSEIFAFRWAAVNGVAIPLNSVRYVGVEYNSGNPQAVVRTTNNWNGQTEFQAATVVNEGGTLHILNNPQETCDGVQKIFHRLIETQPFQFAERLGGGRFSEVGTRNLSLSPCEFYDGLNEFPVTAKDTSTGDTFDAYYGSFTKIAAQTQWDNQNYDNAGTLTALSANRYGVHWLYIEMDDSFALVYGKGNYNTISDAEATLPPASLPLRLSLGSRLAAKLIFQKGASSVIRIESAFDINFKSGMPVSHGDLIDILGNGPFHLSETERDAAIRIATASQSGLMSAAQAQVVSAITTDGPGNVGVGDPTIAARLHVKGSGSTSATTAFKVDNNSNAELFNIKDDGNTDIKQQLMIGNLSSIHENTTVVFEGDSITYGFGLNPGEEWPAVLQTLPSFAGKGTFFNDSASGSTVDSIASRYNTNVLPYAPTGDERAILFVMIGTNDINNGGNAIDTYNSLSSYLTTAKSDGFEIWLFTLTGRSDFTDAKQVEFHKYNKLIRQSQLYDKIIDITPVLPDGSDTNLFQDQRHPTALGAKKIAQYVDYLANLNTSPIQTMSEFINADNGDINNLKIRNTLGVKKIGIGISNPFVPLEISNIDPTISIHSTSANQFESARIRLTELTDNYSGAYLHYDGSANTFNIGRHPTSDKIAGNDVPMFSFGRDSDAITMSNGKIRILSTGNVIVGNGTTVFDNNSIVQLQREASNGGIGVGVASDDPTARGSILIGKKRGTLYTPLAVQNGDQVGEINFNAYDGTALRYMAGVFATIDGAVSTGNVPIGIDFRTGSTTRTVRARINSSGNFSIGEPTISAKFHVKASTSDSSAYGLKLDNSSNAKNFYVRNDGQVDSSGSRVIGFEEFTSDSTLTQSSKSSAVCNPSGTGMVLTMHLSPPDGILQTIVNASAFGVTIGRNGQKIAGIESNYTLPANTSITLQFFGATLGWLIISN